MCQRLLTPIKAVSALAPKYGFVPCGVCPECRANKKASWAFRLRAEIETLSRKGWHVGFTTLTYRESDVPRIPRYFAKKHYNGNMPMCFNREHVNLLIKHLRNWMYRTYIQPLQDKVEDDEEKKRIATENRLRFLVASEFGSSTKRPHYHALIAFPPMIGYQPFYKQIQKFWNDNFGFVIPKDYDGGYDSKNIYHLPFEVDCVSKACVYAAKYVCKDLDYYAQINLDDFYRKYKDDKLSRYLPFHSQSKSLGLAFIKDLTNEQKYNYMMNGVSFVGDYQLRRLPVYLKNKLIFDNYYIIDSTGKRLCRRRGNEFFEKYKKQIFDAKCKMITDKVYKWLDKPFSIVHENKRISSTEMFNRIGESPENLSAYYLAYGGVPNGYAFALPSMVDFWFQRYKYRSGQYNEDGRSGVYVYDDLVSYDTVKGLAFVNDGQIVLDIVFQERMELFFYFCQLMDSYESRLLDTKLVDDEMMVNKLRDFYFNQ